jgi:hypothetical protein
MFSQTGPCTLLPSTHFPLGCLGRQEWKSSESMGVGTIPFLLPSKPYITSILAGWLPDLLPSHPQVSCLADFRPWRWRWSVLLKCQFTYGLHDAISQKIATFITTAVRASNPKWSNIVLEVLSTMKKTWPISIQFIFLMKQHFTCMEQWTSTTSNYWGGWGENNPHAATEHENDSPKANIWCSVMDNIISTSSLKNLKWLLKSSWAIMDNVLHHIPAKQISSQIVHQLTFLNCIYAFLYRGFPDY